jgi:hypothetical protein
MKEVIRMTVAELVKKIFSLEIGIWKAFQPKQTKATKTLVDKARAELKSKNSRGEIKPLPYTRKNISK